MQLHAQRADRHLAGALSLGRLAAQRRDGRRGAVRNAAVGRARRETDE